MNDYFIKLKKNPNFMPIFAKRHSAVMLLLQIAMRAKNYDDTGDPDLKIGEAFIGDYDSYGATEQVYKSDKKFLEKYKIATFKPTNKGTIAKLNNTDFFDVDWEKVTNKVTNKQRAVNEQVTTKKKKENRKAKSSIGTANQTELKKLFSDYNSSFGKHLSIPKSGVVLNNFIHWRKHYSLEQMITALERAKHDEFWGEKITPAVLLRQSNQTGEPVDRISEFLNKKTFGNELTDEEMEARII